MTSELARIQKLHAALVFIVAALATIASVSAGCAVFLGGTVMGLNFWLMRRFFGYLFGPERGRRPGFVIALGLAKQAAFFGLTGLLFWHIDLDAVAFAVGVTMLLVACVMTTVVRQPVAA